MVMCEVLNPDGTPHESNGRATIDDDDDTNDDDNNNVDNNVASGCVENAQRQQQR